MSQERITVIDANSANSQYWRDIWLYRDLLFFLSWRDILVRYKQTVIGIAWAVLRPLITMVVFTLVFSRIAGLPSQGVPYPLLVFAGMLPWYFFSGAFTDVGNSLITNSNMISKVYFPRLIVPASTVAVSFVDFCVSFILMILLMAWYGVSPGWEIVFLPLFIVATGACALGLGLWCAAFNVRYRDFRYIIPFVTQLGLYISPVGFGSSIVPEKWRLIYYVNPMASVIDGFRWALLGAEAQLYGPGIILSSTLIVLLMASGVWYFRRTENTFADVI